MDHMKNLIKVFQLVIIPLWCLQYVQAQSHVAQPKLIYPFTEFINQVITHHPISYQARLLDGFSEANTLWAKGFFDPIIGSEYDQKQFDQKNYFRNYYVYIKVPTPYGIQFVGTYENNSGLFLNPANVVPSSGLFAFGIEIPMLRGLLFDDRREALQQAQIYKQSNDVEQQNTLNELYFNAAMAYLDWQEKYIKYRFREENLQLAEQRLEIARQGFINGDRPAMDTIEAMLNLQNRSLELLDEGRSLSNSLRKVNLFLWQNGSLPLSLDTAAIPQDYLITQWQQAADSIRSAEDYYIGIHPIVTAYSLKNQSLEIEQRLLKEDLKPDIRLHLNPIVQPDREGSIFAVSDYKLGIKAYYPILNRKARGKVAMNKLYMQDLDFQLSHLEQKIRTDLNINWHNQLLTNSMLDISAHNVELSETLLQNEQVKFKFGESSVFIVNARETVFITEQIKLIELQSTLIEHILNYLLSAGVFYFFAP